MLQCLSFAEYEFTGPTSQSAMQMFQMTQMMELNTMFLDQLQEQISMIYMRCAQVGQWMFGVKDHFTGERYQEEVAKYPASSFNTTMIKIFDSYEEKQQVLKKIERRIRLLCGLCVLFLLYAWRKRVRERELAEIARKVWVGIPVGL